MFIKYRKKPVVIEAVRFTDENKDMVLNDIKCNCYADHDKNGDPTLIIETLEGNMTAKIGDYIIRGIKGEYYPCDSDIFYETYESVEEKPFYEHG